MIVCHLLDACLDIVRKEFRSFHYREHVKAETPEETCGILQTGSYQAMKTKYSF